MMLLQPSACHQTEKEAVLRGLFFCLIGNSVEFPMRQKSLRQDAHSHVRKISLRDRARRTKSCHAPLMIKGGGVLVSACGLCSLIEEILSENLLHILDKYEI